jgi:ubiquinone/menaquinone biosynthesis C-methylase UbiE
MIPAFAADAFTSPLIDLGEHESPRFAGVFAPQPEVGARRPGASATFLENAEAYYERHQGFDYWKKVFEHALRSVGVTKADLIVEYGCGFGNGTLPLLELFHDARIVATDISPNLLAILKRLIDARGLSDRCVPVALDAHKPYVREGTADMVAGSAILHHLAEPGELVKAAMRVVKPGGVALFVEPFEAGHALLRLIIREICQEAARREFASPALTWLAEMAVEWNLQIQRDRLPGWRDLDDKWLFPHSVLRDFADRAGSELIVRPIGNGLETDEPFRSQLSYKIRHWRELDPDDPTIMPPWAWDIVRRWDREFFSDGLKEDFLFEACVIFRKRSS